MHKIFESAKEGSPLQHQLPHKHSATALDLAVYAPPGTYTLMARELDAEGQLIDPVKVPWATGSTFVTPPGWYAPWTLNLDPMKKTLDARSFLPARCMLLQ
jgi:hypothetical protein